MSTTVTITSVGAFLRADGETQSRPFRKGATVTLPDDVAEQLVADGNAVEGDHVVFDTPEHGLAESLPLDELTDEQLAAWVADHNAADVVKGVGDDPLLAEAVIDAETARGDKARSTLIDKLRPVTDRAE